MAAAKEDFNYRIAHFKKLKGMNQSSMLTSIEVQFIHMAQGGDGTAAMEGEIRKAYYPTWTNKDFESACEVMGWDHTENVS